LQQTLLKEVFINEENDNNTDYESCLYCNSSADKKKGIMGIDGSGFSDMIYEAAYYIHVMVNGVPVDPADFVLWEDSKRRFGISRCQNNPEIRVKTLFDSVLFGGNSGSDKPPKPCKGKKC
jgi:hypothetical protein